MLNLGAVGPDDSFRFWNLLFVGFGRLALLGKETVVGAAELVNLVSCLRVVLILSRKRLRFLDPNLAGSGDLFPKSSSTLSGFNSIVTGLILEADGRILRDDKKQVDSDHMREVSNQHRPMHLVRRTLSKSIV